MSLEFDTQMNLDLDITIPLDSFFSIKYELRRLSLILSDDISMCQPFYIFLFTRYLIVACHKVYFILFLFKCRVPISLKIISKHFQSKGFYHTSTRLQAQHRSTRIVCEEL